VLIGRIVRGVGREGLAAHEIRNEMGRFFLTEYRRLRLTCRQPWKPPILGMDGKGRVLTGGSFDDVGSIVYQ
jgi:hypothetical protein